MAVSNSFGTLPVVDVSPLVTPEPTGLTEMARQIEAACRQHGFFYVTGHGIAPDLLTRLTAACTAFFALPEQAKMEIAMARGGPAWRGYFPLGAELTSGQPDLRRASTSAPNSARKTPASAPASRCTAPTCSPGRCPGCVPPRWRTSTR